MNVQYHVYVGNSDGGPVDYAVPAATVAAPEYAPPPLAPGSTTRVAVRAFDADSGLEESNVDCVVAITLDAAGRDVTRRPPAPLAVRAVPGTVGSIIVTWRYMIPSGANVPAEFAVWATPGPAVDYDSSPAATVVCTPGKADYRVVLAGLAEDTLHSLAVRARMTDGGDDAGRSSVAATPKGNPPLPILDLTCTPTFRA